MFIQRMCLLMFRQLSVRQSDVLGGISEFDIPMPGTFWMIPLYMRTQAHAVLTA